LLLLKILINIDFDVAKSCLQIKASMTPSKMITNYDVVIC
jgi:hypothetical protein